LDQWGYFETEKVPAMKFNVDDKMRPLIEEFVSLAVDEAGGFAGFRESATKTNSVIDRLEKLTLPKLEDVEQGLEKFIENKEEAEELEEEIQATDELIDAIVFDLYDLTEEEVETVLDSLDTSEGEKASILEKFEEVRE
jgi:seryl-tRNA synthetase